MPTASARRFVLVTGGSLGDVLPYIGLASHLRSLGEDVLLVAGPQLALLARGERIPFQALESAPGDGADSGFDESGGWRAFLRLTDTWVLGSLGSTIAQLDETIRPDDVVVAHPIQIAAALVAQSRGVPWFTVSPAAWLFPNAERMPLYQPFKTLGPALNRLAWRDFGRRLDSRFLGRIRSACEAAGIAGPTGSFLDLCCSPGRALVLSSPLLLDSRRLPAHVTVTGFAHWDVTRLWRNRSGLERYLDEGDDVLAFRAPPHQSTPGFQEAAAAVCRSLGVRGVYIDFRAERSGVDGPLFVDRYIPLSVLAPRSLAGVHYGGLGTSTVFAANGRPAVIMPSTVDQFENADVLAALGAGVRLDWRRWTPARLLSCVERAVEQRDASRSLGAQLTRERGFDVATSVLRAEGRPDDRARPEGSRAHAG